MPRQTDAREQMIKSAALLIRERGVQGTSFADVLEHSGAPRGSIYHHFSGGKLQLAEEAVRWAGHTILTGTLSALQDEDPVKAIAAIGKQWKRVLRDSDFRAGCPIVAATVEGNEYPELLPIAADVFTSWEDAVTGALRQHGLPATRARSLATLILASIEGAIVMARARQSAAPLERVARELQATVEHALGSG